VAAALATPVLVVYGAHAVRAVQRGASPTFFIQYDMPYYLANARQYADGAHAWGAYANPYDFRHDSPRVYFQPLTALLSLAYAVSPAHPGALFVGFGLACTLLAFAALYTLLADYCRPESSGGAVYLTLVGAWGGGLLIVMGTAISLSQGGELDPFIIDPVDGWWFLNLGRNFVYPTEAFYHLVVLLLLVAVFRQQIVRVLAYTCLLAVSHPFTGLQFSLIALAWALLESVKAPHVVTRRLAILFTAPLAAVIGYYLWFLPRFPSHRVLVEQWTIDWSLSAITAVAAHLPLAVLAAVRWIRTGRAFLRSPFERFLAVTFAVSMLLANHDAVIEPRQPLHFTRGYTWLPLYVLAAPLLLDWWERARRSVLWSRPAVGVAALTALLLVDNVAFLARVTVHGEADVVLSQEERRVLEFLDREYPGHVIVSDVPMLAYLSATFTSLRPYHGHWANTPWAARRAAEVERMLRDGTIPEPLCRDGFVVVARESSARFEEDPRFARRHSDGPLAVFVPRRPGQVCPGTVADAPAPPGVPPVRLSSNGGHSRRWERAARQAPRVPDMRKRTVN
jgi:hypothetical protein